MTRVYISDHGDDRNDGLTKETAIYSWQRAVKLCDGNTETNLMQGDATLQRLTEEIERRKKNETRPTEADALLAVHRKSKPMAFWYRELSVTRWSATPFLSGVKKDSANQNKDRNHTCQHKAESATTVGSVAGNDPRFQVDDRIAEENCMDEVLVSKVIEKISQTGTAFLDIIHLADLHLEDGKPLDLPKIRQEAETGFKNMEELNAAFAKLVNPDVG